MSLDLPCADRCPKVEEAILRHARDEITERTERLSLGLTPVYVPITPTHEATAVCTECGQVYHGPAASLAARECAEFDR